MKKKTNQIWEDLLNNTSQKPTDKNCSRRTKALAQTRHIITMETLNSCIAEVFMGIKCII